MEGHGRLLRSAAAATVGPPRRLGVPAADGRFSALAGCVSVYPGRMDRCEVDGVVVAGSEGGFYGGWITAESSARSRAHGTWGW